MRSARSDGTNVRALRAFDAIAGKREGRGVTVNLAFRAGNFAFAREDSLDINLAVFLDTLEASKAMIPVGEIAEHTSKSESTRYTEGVRQNELAKLVPDSSENQQQC